MTYKILTKIAFEINWTGSKIIPRERVGDKPEVISKLNGEGIHHKII